MTYIKALFLIGALHLLTISPTVAQNNSSGFFMWDEATDNAVIEDVISKGVNSFRSRDITILYRQPIWNLFKQYGDEIDVMVSIPINYTFTNIPVDLQALADSVNKNPFIKRLQIYPKLQPGLMNPSELNPCNDWLTGYADEFERRIRLIDSLVTDKSVEILVAGQMGSPGCSDLTQIMNTLYDLQENGRNVGWGMTVYPYFYGDLDASFTTLSNVLDQFVSDLDIHTPPGKETLPFRAIESGWPSECSPKATLKNHCEFAESVFDYHREGVKIYYFELQDFPDGWSECEKHFGLYDKDGNIKCDNNVVLSHNSLEENKKSGMKIFYSNNGELRVKFDESKSGKILLHTTNGQIIESYSIDNIAEKNISVSTLSQGMYFIQFIGLKDQVSSRFFVD